jgi:uncharacterized protein YjiS (DUF1127 family)
MLANRVIASWRELPVERPRTAQRLRHLGEWLGRALHNHATRRYLAEMDDRMLADVGISRAQAQTEASRWMWD